MNFLIFTLIILTAILWIWALVELSRSRFEKPMMKWLWIVLVFLFPILGSLAYFQFGRNFSKAPRKFSPDFHKDAAE